jgi:GNAT superfamily N-acetyltransferase
VAPGALPVLRRVRPKPDKRLVLKIAETRRNWSSASLLHDAYVAAGFMKPAPSGLRATIYHALPTTTTLCAKFDGQVVGTLSLIRESVFGFPLQAIFDLTEIRARGGKIAEVSALAVHPDFRKTGGAILFPLMKFMYEYCTTFFDTRHLVIAVHPTRIEMYESLLFFERLTENKVDNYDFANGAPAVGASLDLRHAPQKYREVYGKKPPGRTCTRISSRSKLPNIVLPGRRYFTTNDPVMTTELLDYFFNQRTQVFEGLGMRERIMLHAIYNLPEHQKMLPSIDDGWGTVEFRFPGPRQRRDPGACVGQGHHPPGRGRRLCRARHRGPRQGQGRQAVLCLSARRARRRMAEVRWRPDFGEYPRRPGRGLPVLAQLTGSRGHQAVAHRGRQVTSGSRGRSPLRGNALADSGWQWQRRQQ